MHYFTNEQIKPLLSAENALQWVREAFSVKEASQLPHKISLAFREKNFMNTMPCIIPQLDVFGAKIVTRYEGRTPSVDGDLLLYRYGDGALLALMQAFEITTWRTGAVAALAVETFARADFSTIGIMGLGNTGLATLKCLAHLYGNRPLNIHLLRYKNHVERVIPWLKEHTQWNPVSVTTSDELVRHSDVMISCITYTGDLIAADDAYRPGCLVVPVHTRGFQNCDLFFDKVFADDTSHVQGFKYFNRFKRFAELPSVLNGTAIGRENSEERILSYNIGIALHDIVFAHHLYSQLIGQN